MDFKKTLWADLILLIVAILWGGGFIAAKLALSVLPPIWLIIMRFFISGGILLIFSFFQLKTFQKKTIQTGIALGVIMFIGFCFQTYGLKYTSAGKQGFLISTYTVIVPYLSWLITKSKPNRFNLLASVITVLGVGLLSLNSEFRLSLGDSLTLVFALVFALQIVLTGLFARDANVLHLTAVQMTTTGVLAIFAAIIMKSEIPTNYVSQMPAILYMIFMCTLSAVFLQNFAQKHTKDSHASIIIALEAVFGFLLAALILKESLSLKSILGCFIIFTAVFVSKLKPVEKLITAKDIKMD